MQVFLRTRPLFAGATVEAFGRLLEKAQRRRLEAGEYLFRQDEPATHVFVVEDGLLEVLHELSDDPDRHVADVRRGAVVGELGVMRGDARTASVRALEPCTLVALPGRDFVAFVRATPSAALRLTELLAARAAAAVAQPVDSGRGECWGLERTEDLEASFAAALARAVWKPSARGEPPTIWCTDGAQTKMGKAFGLRFEPLPEVFRPRPDRIEVVLGAAEGLRKLPLSAFIGGSSAAPPEGLPAVRCVRMTRAGPLGPRTLRFLSHRLHETAERVVRVLERRSIGLALGGGGALGLCHLGVWEVLKRERIPVDFVAGTSAGALMGGMVLSRGLANAMEEARGFSRARLYGLVDLSFFFSGVIQGHRILNLFRDLLGNTRIESLPISFAALALDLETGEERALTTGPLAEALRSSVSLPSVFAPYTYADEEGSPAGTYIDAGGVNNVPVDVARELGAHRVVGVNVINRPKGWTKNGPPWRSWSPITRGKMIAYAEMIGFARNGERQVFTADVAILPDTKDVGFTQFYRAGELIEKGRQAAEELLPQLRALSRR